MTTTLDDQLQQAVTENRRGPRPLKYPSGPGWWVFHGEDGIGTRYVDEDDLADDAIESHSGDWYGPLPSEAPEADATLDDLSGTAADRLKRYVALEEERRSLEDRLKETKFRIAAMQPNILEDFAAAGAHSIRCDKLTVFIKTNRYVSKGKGIETQTICDVMQEIGLGQMVRDGYSPSTLKAWVVEQMTLRDQVDKQVEQGVTVPPEMVEQANQARERLDRLAPLLNIGSKDVINATRR